MPWGSLRALPNMGWRFRFQPHGFLNGSCTSRVPLRLVWSCAYNIDAHVLGWWVFYGEKGRDVSSTWYVSACRHIADTSYDAMHISKKCKQNVFQYRVILFDEIQFDPICFLFLLRHASATVKTRSPRMAGNLPSRHFHLDLHSKPWPAESKTRWESNGTWNVLLGRSFYK